MFSSKQSSTLIDGKHTEILVQSYIDRVLVLVSQLGKVGNLIQASLPSTIPLLPPPPVDASQPNVRPLPPPSPAIQLTPLFGRPPTEHIQTLHSLYAAQIATIVWTEESQGELESMRRSVVVGLALQKSESGADMGLTESERRVFNGVMCMVQDLLSSST
ncbi:hypothetical protein BDQ17DRAFT_1341680 [Cyathus striatus]|nr:hypothetical protein BDQ17DRAFT_1341680 [Cyathus striatus]